MTQKEVARKRSAQLSIRLDETLYLDYKNLLASEDVSMTDDIEAYIRHRLGRNEGKKTNVVDFVEALEKQQKEIEELREEMGKLKAGWPQKTRNSKVS